MEPSELTDKAIDYMLPDLESRVAVDDPKLSQWEKEQFLPSIIEQWNSRHRLSDRQKEILGKIWDKL